MFNCKRRNGTVQVGLEKFVERLLALAIMQVHGPLSACDNATGHVKITCSCYLE